MSATTEATQTVRTTAAVEGSPGHVQFPDWQMEDPYSARLPSARSGEKSRRAPSVGELQMTGRCPTRALDATRAAGPSMLWPSRP